MAMVVQRGWDRALCPVYDMMNHNNGRLNTNNTSVFGEHGFQMESIQDIQAGEELFLTYNDCVDCTAYEKSLKDFRGTADIVRDFGFVESYPHAWSLSIPHTVKFQVHELTDKEGNLEYTVTWLDESWVDNRGLQFLSTQIFRLDELLRNKITPSRPLLPENEWRVIVDYVNALRTDMLAAINSVKRTYDEGYCTLEECLMGGRTTTGTNPVEKIS